MCIEFVIQEGEINILGLYLCTAVGIVYLEKYPPHTASTLKTDFEHHLTHNTLYTFRYWILNIEYIIDIPRQNFNMDKII